MGNNIKSKLNELQSTAICGNDISSSCLYVSALTIAYAGKYAWISLIIVAFVLFLFRKIYSEVVGALPLNGGAYNVLLNTTTKRVASVAACLTILSYMATAVVSGYEAMFYLHDIFSDLPIQAATVVLLAGFMILAIIGIGESAFVAVIIFIIHLLSLTVLIVACTWFLVQNGLDNIEITQSISVHSGGALTALFLGFSVAMLGISGFESSANFVEEQQHGVFRKTLRNMWLVVSFFNPVIALLALNIIPIQVINEHKESLLSFMGRQTGGPWLGMAISIDAVLVLSGAVLTSYIGVTGLIERMALDRILPNLFLVKNKKGISYRIVITFFFLCVSVLFVTRGDLSSLAGVYTFSFLTVMVLFGIGNLLLKIKRTKLPRPEKAHVLAVVGAILMVTFAFFGNMQLNITSFYLFLRYFIPAVLLVVIMLNRALIVTWLIYLIEYLDKPLQKLLNINNEKLERLLKKISNQEFVFFTRGDNVAVLNRVMLYVENNETTKKLKIVHIANEESNNENLKKDIQVLDRAYPEIKIDFVEIEGVFGPKIIDELSRKWEIPKNFMFIGTLSNKFPYHISELGGVRLIM